jgi:putative PIN family toxin of toxin-antitoxin system
MRYAVAGAYELITPAAVRDELVRNVRSKRYLRDRIVPMALDELIQLLNVREESSDIESMVNVPTVRDLDDYFVLVSAIEADADVLVTGDDDLLVLSQLLERPRILDPAEFVAELQTPEYADT